MSFGMTVMLESLDHVSVLQLNYFAASNELFYTVISGLQNSPLLKGFPIFFALVWLWFDDGYQKRRGRILAGLFAACLAVVISVWFQYHIHIHTRPFLDETLHIKLLEPGIAEGWNRLGSFPSDTATLYFSLSSIIFLESPVVGSIALLWAFLFAGVFRIMIGYHYPSDILGGLALGLGCVYLFETYTSVFFDSLIKRFQSREYIINGIFFILLAEAYNVFDSFQRILHGLMKHWHLLH
jgi:undecaprenyl-diphosphatase